MVDLFSQPTARYGLTSQIWASASHNVLVYISGTHYTCPRRDGEAEFYMGKTY